jgi:hypothetical protein
MQPYIHALRESVRESRYAVDERAVADAMLTRAKARVSADRAEVQKHLPWLDLQINQLHRNDGGWTAPAQTRSALGGPIAPASHRRATVRGLHDDIKARMTEFLAQHPGSTTGDLARSLNLSPGSAGG